MLRKGLGDLAVGPDGRSHSAKTQGESIPGGKRTHHSAAERLGLCVRDRRDATWLEQ